MTATYHDPAEAAEIARSLADASAFYAANPRMDAYPDALEELTPLDEQCLDAALGDNFHAEWIGDGYAVDCSGCGVHVVDDIEDAVALIETHRARHDAESREVWA